MEESDEAEGGSQATQGRLLVGVELGHMGPAGYRRRPWGSRLARG